MARDLQDRDFAREFLLAAAVEEVPLQLALRKVIQAYGIDRFASDVELSVSQLNRALSPEIEPTHGTLQRLLYPFGLKLSVTPLASVGGADDAA
ncbi:MAG: hypothetical protein AAFX40_18415 [Cyanobacteria bacterium J06639_1]